MNNPRHYDELTARQIDQYKETEVMHDLPLIYKYWSKKHISERAATVIGYSNTIEFYAEYFRKSLRESDSGFLVSIGSGDCSIEIDIVKNLLSKQERNFFFICLELSPLFIEKARRKIDQEGLGDIITVSQTDINNWQPKYKFAGVMAHHSLHHFLNLEQLFELIKNNLAKNGRFLTCDIIGRNGHMRWAESLILTRKIWERIPRKYKYHHLLKKIDDYFDNWDCSNEGFEGIRAEDILPLLIKTFSFEIFFCYGNLTDPFLDRGFGPNYDPLNPSDTAFIDYLHETNERLISDGILKPTCIIAVMTNEKREPAIYKHWTPEFAVRDPNSQAPLYDPEPLLKDIPFKISREDDPLVVNRVNNYTLNTQLRFANQNKSEGYKYLKYGWCSPEDDFTWSSCEAAALIFPLGHSVSTDLFLRLEFIPYQSPLNEQTVVNILVNNTHVETASYGNTTAVGCSVLNIGIPASVVTGKKIIEVTLLFPNRRKPQYEGGNDLRALGIALISAKICKKVA